MRTSHLPMLIYRTLSWLLAPYLYRRFAKEGRDYNDPLFAAQRRGHHHPGFSERPLWFHAASVGEVNALLPLIEAIQRERPQLPLLLTSNTASSGALARDKLPPGITHAYLPFDWHGAMQRFLLRTRPRLGIIMETELWPNLYQLCDEAEIALLIVNGRVSEKTLQAPGWLRRLYRDCLQATEQILARSELDRERFLQLGAAATQCRVLGNIKFAVVDHQAPPAIELKRDYVLAASSRNGEERLIVEAWLRSGRDELLVIAPRHPQRLDEILRDLASYGLHTAIRSRGEEADAQTKLYIADTFGELRALMAGATLVFMGGSLVPRGGHNILEPAALGRAVITGPHMDNFLDETRTLLAGGGMLQVSGVEELGELFATLLADDTRREELARLARNTVLQQREVVERYLETLQSYL